VELVVDGSYCACDAGSHVLRPGIGTKDWGGVGADPCAAEDQSITIDFIAADYADNTAPVIVSCPPDELEFDAGVGGTAPTVTWTAPSARDYADNIVLLGAGLVPTMFPESAQEGGLGIKKGTTDIVETKLKLGTTTVMYAFEDTAGNSANCLFTVAVKDATAPTVGNCPNVAIARVLPALQAGMVVDWEAIEATDDVDGTLVVSAPTTSPSKGLDAGEVFPSGNTTVVYSVADAAGNAASCSFVVSIVDATAPVFDGCPSNLEASAPDNSSAAIVAWAHFSAKDAVDGAVTTFGPHTTPTAGANNGSAFGIGVTTVEYSAMDAVENVATCRFNVTVHDKQAPRFLTCPPNSTHVLDANQPSFVRSWGTPTAIDVVDGPIEVVFVQYSSSRTVAAADGTGLSKVSTVVDGAVSTVVADSSAGTFIYQYSAADTSGNVAICEVAIVVVDATPPAVTGCPDAQLVATLIPGETTAAVEWSVPTATDNVDGQVQPVLSGSPSSDGRFVAGEHTVLYTFTDSSQNVAVCAVEIMIYHREVPLFEVGLSEFAIVENAKVGAVVGTISVLCSVPFSVSVGGNSFAVSGSSDTIKLITSAPLDRETTARYTLTISAQAEGSGISASTTITVVISDANDNAPKFAAATLYGAVIEGAPAGTLIPLFTPTGTLVNQFATDADAGNNGLINFTFAGDSRFKFDSEGGNVVLQDGDLDREESPRLLFLLTARDNGGQPKSSTVTVVIIVEDVNDNPPMLDMADEFLVNGTNPGTTVGVASAYDLDADAVLVYEIVPSAETALFAVHRTSGLISVLSPLAPPPSDYSFTLRVSDGAFATAAVLHVHVQPDPACVNVECESDPCFGPPLCIGQGMCVLGTKVDVRTRPECQPVCTCPADGSAGVDWEQSDCNLLRTASCPGTDSYGVVTRTCGPTGEWREANFGNCVQAAILNLAATGVSGDADLDALGTTLAAASNAGEALGALDVANIAVIITDVAALVPQDAASGRHRRATAEQSTTNLIQSASNALDASPLVQAKSHLVTSATTGTIELTIVFSPWTGGEGLTILERSDLTLEIRQHAPQLTGITIVNCVADGSKMTVVIVAELRTSARAESLINLNTMMSAGSLESATSSPLLVGLQEGASSGMYGGKVLALSAGPIYRDTIASVTTAVQALLQSVALHLDGPGSVSVETRNIAGEARKLDCAIEAVPAVYHPPSARNNSIALSESVIADRCVGNANVEVVFVVFEETSPFETNVNASNSSASADIAATLPAGECIVDPQAYPPNRVLGVQISAANVAASTPATSSASASDATHMVSIAMSLPDAPDDAQTISLEDTMCVAWDHVEEKWSSDECSLDLGASTEEHAMCRCTSVNGHYAALSIVKTCSVQGAVPVDDTAVRGVYLAVLLTAVPLYLLVFLTFARFTHLRTVQKYVLMHLSLAMGLALLFASIGATRALGDDAPGCRFVAGVGYYLFLVVLMWMMMDGWCFWRSYSQKFADFEVQMDERETQWMLVAAAYGVPLLIIGMVAAVASDDFGSSTNCWLGGTATPAYWTPLVMSTLFNLVILVAIVTQQCRESGAPKEAVGPFHRHRELEFRRNLRANGVHLPFSVLMWVSGILATQVDGNNAFAAAFLVFATLAGGSSALFNVVLEDEVWEEWTRGCCKGSADGALSAGKSGPPLSRRARTISESIMDGFDGGLSDPGGIGPLSATSNPRSAASTVAPLPNLAAAGSRNEPPQQAVSRMLAHNFAADGGEFGGKPRNPSMHTIVSSNFQRSDSRHKRKAATSATARGSYWEGIPVQALGRQATPNMHVPADEFSSFDSSSGNGWRQNNRAEEEMYGDDVPPPGFPQATMHRSEHGGEDPWSWDAVVRDVASQYNVDDGANYQPPRDATPMGAMPLHNKQLAAPSGPPTRALLEQREQTARWSAQNLTTAEEELMGDATLLRTAKVLALRDARLTYLLHFEPGELRLLQDKLHEL
jgi:hypothetical protein